MCSSQELLVLPVLWSQLESNLAVALRSPVCLSLCWVAPDGNRVFIYVLLCPQSLPAVSLLAPSAPVTSGRQSVSPLHEGFFSLIKLACAFPEGFVGAVKVKEKMF